ncbi:MAG: hypothetical protein IT326_09465 [Anaerolineae bacterium]|nr:hypothetical protein [Anaerolineae bacterium]
MAYTYLLENSAGTELGRVEDREGNLWEIIFSTRLPDDETPRLIDYIDPYDDVIFNSTQMDRVLQELTELSRVASSIRAIAVIDSLLALIERKYSHTFLRVLGD